MSRLACLLRTRCSERVTCALLVALLVGLLVPVFVLAWYDVPSADDFFFGWRAHVARVNGGSILDVLAAAWAEVADIYITWQGTFSAIFAMALQPAVFGERCYVVVPFIMIGALAAATLFFCDAVFRGVAGTRRLPGVIVGLTVLVIDTQFLPSALEGFYWYNGAVYYTFFHAASLVLLGLMALYAAGRMSGRAGRVAALVGMCVLGVLVGGSNYTTALVTSVAFALVVGLMAIARNPRWRPLLVPLAFLLVALAFLLVAFLISIVAPGNAERQAENYSPGAIVAIVKSVYESVSVLGMWLVFPVLLLIGVLVPTLWGMARESRLSFAHPVWVGLISWALVAVQFCPPIYAMGTMGPVRLLNIIFFSLVLLVVFNVFYLCGFAQRRFGLQEGLATSAAVGRHAVAAERAGARGYRYPVLALVAVVVVLAVCMRDSLQIPTAQPYTSVAALRDLRSGEPAHYLAEMRERVAVLSDPSVTDAVVPPFSVHPSLLWMHDALDDPTYWVNTSIADYYQKDSVVVR